MKSLKKIGFAVVAAAMLFGMFACSNAASSGGGGGSGNVTRVSIGDSGIVELGAYRTLDDTELESYGITATSVPEKISGATYVAFGTWPQTIKAANVTVDEKTVTTLGMHTYYKGSDDAWYAKVSANPYKETYTFSDAAKTVITKGANYYFKVEPIVWRVLKTDGGKKMLLSEKELTVMDYYPYYNVDREIDGKSVYPCNYEHSKIRAFLNGISYTEKASDSSSQTMNNVFENKGFLNTAFTADDIAKIQSTEIDKSFDSMKDKDGDAVNTSKDIKEMYACDNTTDKIFLLSKYEVTDTAFGFAEKSVEKIACKVKDTKRYRVVTDFAKAKGATKFKKNGDTGQWWLRSPSFEAGMPQGVNDSGQASHRGFAGDNAGVVPALWVQE